MSDDYREEVCVSCGLPATGRHGLPVDASAAIVSNNFAGEWVAMPACEGCHAVHAAAWDRGPVVLEAHVKATKDLRERIAEARLSFRRLRDHARHAMDRLAGDDAE
jgi:hypothetical protein